MAKRNFRELVLRVLDENSGGMKMVELVAVLVAAAHSDGNGEDYSDELANIEESLRAIPELKLVEYTWKSMNRAKTFVCTI